MGVGRVVLVAVEVVEVVPGRREVLVAVEVVEMAVGVLVVLALAVGLVVVLAGTTLLSTTSADLVLYVRPRLSNEEDVDDDDDEDDKS